VLLAFNDKAITNADDLVAQVSATAPGIRATVKYVSDGQERAQIVTIEKLPLDLERTSPPVSEDRVDFGLTLEDITPLTAAHLRLAPGLDGGPGAVSPDAEGLKSPDPLRSAPPSATA
jgi:hypothetical protein